MNMQTKVREVLSQHDDYLREVELTKEQIKQLAALKVEILNKVEDYDKLFRSITGMEQEFVIRMYVNDKFEGYVDTTYALGGESIILTDNIDKVDYKVFYNKEDVEREIKTLQNKADAYNNVLQEYDSIVYIWEQRR